MNCKTHNFQTIATDDDGRKWSSCTKCGAYALNGDIVAEGLETLGATKNSGPELYMQGPGKEISPDDDDPEHAWMDDEDDSAKYETNYDEDRYFSKNSLEGTLDDESDYEVGQRVIGRYGSDVRNKKRDDD